MQVFDQHIRGGKIAPIYVRELLVLSFEQRQKARQRVRLESGADVGIRLERGTILRGGDYLKASDGAIVRVVAAPEPVSVATCTDALLLAKAAYHLGNRHVQLELGAGYLRYLVDHVLDHMVESLGLRVTHVQLPFEPEGGAYSHAPDRAAAHGHADAHGPVHRHGHEH
jgi:urease accessory protein